MEIKKKKQKKQYQIVVTTHHLGQHSNCLECITLPAKGLCMISLPREKPGNRMELSEIRLDPSNSTPKFKDGVVQSDLQFLQYKIAIDLEPSEFTKM